MLFTSSSTINRWRLRYRAGGLAAVLQAPRRQQSWRPWWIALILRWVTLQSPRDFGFYRSRWTCGTIVALLAMLLAIDNGYQACLMAPTEILARQHYEGISELLKDMPLRVGLLTGSSKSKARKDSKSEG